MGLIKAGVGAINGVLADQWKEFFYCEALDKNILVTKGQKRIGKRSSNTKGSDNIISNGSGIAVADGQCMIIVEQGKIVEVCAEPENLLTIVRLNQVFLQENWVMGLKRRLRQSANDLHLAEIPEKTRGFIILILKKS